jgi:hypothetical protein
MEQQISCRHYTPDSQIGTKTPSLALAITNGTATQQGEFKGICDWRIPVGVSELSGQDISCAGSHHPDCPDPQTTSVSPNLST